MLLCYVCYARYQEPPLLVVNGNFTKMMNRSKILCPKLQTTHEVTPSVRFSDYQQCYTNLYQI